MAKKVLVVVDMQNDFLTGPLGNAECEATIEPVCKLIKEKSWDYIFATADTHTPDYMNTQEGKRLPVIHCVEGTDGWKLNDSVDAAISEAVNAGTAKKYEFVKKETFGSTSFLHRLEELRATGDDYEFIFCGVCTGICVISNAMLAKATMPEAHISIVADACGCVTPESHNTALAAMKMCHMDII